MPVEQIDPRKRFVAPLQLALEAPRQLTPMQSKDVEALLPIDRPRAQEIESYVLRDPQLDGIAVDRRFETEDAGSSFWRSGPPPVRVLHHS